MAADSNRLQGEICENPIVEEKNIPQLLEGMLKALINEQRRLAAAGAAAAAEIQELTG